MEKCMNQANHILTAKPCKTTPYQFGAIQSPLEKKYWHCMEYEKKKKQIGGERVAGQQLFFQAFGSEFK